MNSIVFFTICARNYMANAVTLGSSIKFLHPDAKFVIWILDEESVPELPEGITGRSILECLTPTEWRKFLLQYDILEYATAVKPSAFLQHFAENNEIVIYLDPDIFVYRPMVEIFKLLQSDAVAVITPHITEPLPRDNLTPSDLDILRSGVYNLGFLAFRRTEETIAFTNWWKGWLKTHCFNDPRSGVFTDQKWMDFTLSFLKDAVVLRHKGYNVAYWNLPQRKISRTDTGWYADSEPLVFFHFSGFNPQQISALSKHQTRIRVGKNEALYQLCVDYSERVQTIGISYAEEWVPTTFRFENGSEFDIVCKKAYANAIVSDIEFSDLFGIKEGSFYRWINEPIETENGDPPFITRYLKTLYEMREDVQKAYPDLLGADRSGFFHWANKSAPHEMGIDVSFLDEARRYGSASPTQLRYIGYLRSEMGVGEAARGYVRALLNQGRDAKLIDVSSLAVHRSQDLSLGEMQSFLTNSPCNFINIFHINADELPNVMDHLKFMHGQNSYTIGFWAWETTDFPRKWRDRFSLVNEIWTASNYMAEAISKVSPVPVVCIPHVIQVPEVESNRAKMGLAENEFIFLFHFDFLSFAARKNPEGAIEAFRLAFSTEEPVRLVIKSMNAEREPERLNQLITLAENLRVTFINETLDSKTRFQLIQSCDAYVSLHRAEGFGLGIAEAMAMGKPVVATGWSGNMDFMNVSNSLPVRYHLKPLEYDIGPYQSGTLWAEPDLEHAATLMRSLFESKILCDALGERAKTDVNLYLSEEAVALRLNDRLNLITELYSHSVSTMPAITRTPYVHWAERNARSTWLLVKKILPPYLQIRITRIGKRVLRKLRAME